MGRNLRLCLVALLVLAFIPQANSQGGVTLAQTCFHQNQPCYINNLTCPSDERIVILNELHAFKDVDTTCTDRCSFECCQGVIFQCMNRVSYSTFSRTFLDCWNKTQCHYRPVPENRVFTENNCTGSSVSARLSFNCIKESSVRDFTDPTPAVGNLLMAVFSPSFLAYPPCVILNSTMQCLVEANRAGDLVQCRVMLVTRQSTAVNCSKLHITAGSYKSSDMPCGYTTAYSAIDYLSVQNQFTFVLQLTNLETEAWAVVHSPQILKMTCGQTCTYTTAVPSSSSASSSPFSTKITPQSDPTFPTEPGSATPHISSMRPPSSSDSVSQSDSTTTTGVGRTSMETGGGDAITTPVIATLAVLSVLLATALCVAVWVILRQRRALADDTYARTLPVSAEERTYASLHAPGPRPQVVSLEPFSHVQPELGPARGGHPREPQYENVA